MGKNRTARKVLKGLGESYNELATMYQSIPDGMKFVFVSQTMIECAKRIPTDLQPEDLEGEDGQRLASAIVALQWWSDNGDRLSWNPRMKS